MTTELIRQDPQPLDVRRESVLAINPSNPFELLAFAVREKLDVASMKELCAMAEHFEAKQAKRLFFEAKSAFQREVPQVLKTSKGASGTKHAKLEQIIEMVGPYIFKHGFSWEFNEVKPDSPGNKRAQVKITHTAKSATGESVGGHFELSECEVRIDGRNTMANDPQKDMLPHTRAQPWNASNTLFAREANKSQ